jgi:hypothetical protein
MISNWHLKITKSIKKHEKKIFTSIILNQQVFSFIQTIENRFFITLLNSKIFCWDEKIRKLSKINSFLKISQKFMCKCLNSKLLFFEKLNKFCLEIFSIGKLIVLIFKNIFEKTKFSNCFLSPRNSSKTHQIILPDEKKFSKKLKLFKEIFKKTTNYLITKIKNDFPTKNFVVSNNIVF